MQRCWLFSAKTPLVHFAWPSAHRRRRRSGRPGLPCRRSASAVTHTCRLDGTGAHGPAGAQGLQRAAVADGRRAHRLPGLRQGTRGSAGGRSGRRQVSCAPGKPALARCARAVQLSVDRHWGASHFVYNFSEFSEAAEGPRLDPSPRPIFPPRPCGQADVTFEAGVRFTGYLGRALCIKSVGSDYHRGLWLGSYVRRGC